MDRKKSLEQSNEGLKELFDLIQKLKFHFDQQFRDELKRSLPFSELLFDRWERAQQLGFGIGASIYDSAHVFGEVNVGENTWVGPFTILDGSGRLIIGKNCSISAAVQIYTHDSVEWAVSAGVKPYQYAPTTIGNNCYIGPQSIIAMGVTLGDGCIVGANSFVNSSFPPGSKIAGTPAKLIS